MMVMAKNEWPWTPSVFRAVAVVALMLAAAPVFSGPFDGTRNDADRGDGFGYLGVGIGQYFTKESGADGWERRRTAVSFESALGGRVSDRVGFFVLTTIAINEVQAGVEYAEWAWKNDEWTVIRAPFAGLLIPFAFLADSQALIGPGLAIYLLPGTPSLYLEGGIGLSSVQSVADRVFMFGGGAFAGIGADITRRMGFGLRAMWTPDELASDWFSRDFDAMTVTGSLRLRLGGR